MSIASAQPRRESLPGMDGSGAPSPGQPTGLPLSPSPENPDWIQLTSGEWLKGEIKTLYEYELQFDSIKLGLLTLDWNDIRQIQGHQPHSVRFKRDASEKGTTVTGILTMVDDTVTVDTEDGKLEFDRSRLFSISADEARFISSWSAKVSLSLGVRNGNSEQVAYSGTASFERFTPGKRFRFDYIGIFNKTDGEEIANSQRIDSHYDIFRTTRFYWRPVFATYFHDPISNIQSLTSIGSGLGYRLIYTPKTILDITTGVAYQYTENVSAEAGIKSHSSTPALALVADYELELTDNIDFNTTYTLDIVNQDAGKYWHHIVAGLEIGVTSRIDLDLSLVWDRTKSPKEKEDGSIPEKDDYHFIFGIGFKY